MNKKPVTFWIYLGIVLVVTVLLTALTALSLHKIDAAQIEAAASEELTSRLTYAAQQNVNLGAMGAYLAACLLDLPFGLLTVALGTLIGGLIHGSFAYLIPSTLNALGIFLLARMKGVDKERSWKSSLLIVLLCAGWTVLVYFLCDLIFLHMGYTLACVDFVSHLGEGLLCAGAGLLMIRIKQTRMIEKGDSFVSVAKYEQSETSQTSQDSVIHEESV